MIEILNNNGKVIKTVDEDDLRWVDLREANLRWANLSWADLSRAKVYREYL